MREYRVFKYQYIEMKKPKWGAIKRTDSIDCLPCTCFSLNGQAYVLCKANNKKEAIQLVKNGAIAY